MRAVTPALITLLLLTLLGVYATPALADTSVTYGYSYSIPPDITLSNVFLSGGDAIAPHLYNWWFDGTGYIVIPYDSWLDLHNKSHTVLALTKAVKESSTSPWSPLTIVQQYAYGLYYKWDDKYLRAHTNDGSNTKYLDYTWVNDGGWHEFAQAFNSSSNSLYIYLDGNYVAEGISGTSAVTQTTNNPIIGRGWYAGDIHRLIGYMGFTAIINKTLTSSELNTIFSGVVTNTDSIRLFFDPTFFNGTHYLDLVNSSIAGIPYGGVARVPANETWLWLIKGLYGDGYVHLRFFPRGSIVKFVNPSTGEAVETVVINGTPNDAGLVNDTAVDLPEGNYSIQVWLPWIHYIDLGGLIQDNIIYPDLRDVGVTGNYSNVYVSEDGTHLMVEGPATIYLGASPTARNEYLTGTYAVRQNLTNIITVDDSVTAPYAEKGSNGELDLRSDTRVWYADGAVLDFSTGANAWGSWVFNYTLPNPDVNDLALTISASSDDHIYIYAYNWLTGAYDQLLETTGTSYSGTIALNTSKYVNSDGLVLIELGGDEASFKVDQLVLEHEPTLTSTYGVRDEALSEGNLTSLTSSFLKLTILREEGFTQMPPFNGSVEVVGSSGITDKYSFTSSDIEGLTTLHFPITAPNPTILTVRDEDTGVARMYRYLNTATAVLPTSGEVVNYVFTVNDLAGYVRADATWASFMQGDHVVAQALIGLGDQFTVTLKYGSTYVLSLDNGEEVRTVGFVIADDQQDKVIYVTHEVSKDTYSIPSIRVYRNGSSVIAEYYDAEGVTEAGNITFLQRNGTEWVKVMVSPIGNDVRAVLNDALTNTSYLIIVQAVREGYPFLNVSKVIPPERVGSAFPIDLSFLGDLGVPTKYLIPFLIVVFIAGAFGSLYSGIGLVLAVGTAGAFTLMGWLNIPLSTIAFAAGVAVIYALRKASQHGGGP